MHWKLFAALPPAYSNKDTEKEVYCHKQVKMIWRKKHKYYEIRIWQCLNHIGSYAELFYQSQSFPSNTKVLVYFVVCQVSVTAL